MKLKKLHILPFVLSTLFIISSMKTKAQDLHFTQYTNCVQLYNPALTGQFEQMMKGTLLHKRQWRNVGGGYTTSGFDAQYKLLSLFNDNYTGFGILVLQDEAGKADMKTFMLKADVAYHLVASSSDLLSAGVQLGYEQRSLNFEGLAWDSQYNGVNYDPTLDDKERFIATKRGFIDLGVGFNWKHKGKRRFNMGYSLFHSGQQITMVARGDDKLKIRQVLHASKFKKYKYFEVKSDLFIQRQAGAMEVVLGTTFDYRIGGDSKYTNVKTSSGIKAGCFYRFKDAIHPFLGFEYKRSVGISIGYDVRIAKMPNISKRAGGPEIAISYLGSPGRRRMKIVH